eukprot:sb/3476590/
MIQGIPEIQSILLRDMRRRGLTRKAVQKCRQRQNIRMHELDQRKRYLQNQLTEAIRIQERKASEYELVRARYEHVQRLVVEYLQENPLATSQGSASGSISPTTTSASIPVTTATR